VDGKSNNLISPDDSVADSWSELVSNYKISLLTQLEQCKCENENSSVASFSGTKVFFLDINTGKQGALTGITLGFQPLGRSEISKVKIKFQILQPANDEVQIRITLLQNNDYLKYHGSKLLVSKVDADENNLVQWRGQINILDWGTKDVPDYGIYAKKWYVGQNCMSFDNGLKNVKPTIVGKTYSLNYNEGDLPEHNLKLPLSTKVLKDITGIHAKLMVARAIDWVVFSTFMRSQFDIEIKGVESLNLQPEKELGLIDSSDYYVKRTIDLSPFELQSKVEKRGLFFSWNVYQTICASMNLGRHLILTGPPGCGKSQLAILIAEMIAEGVGSNVRPKMVTASPSWTSGDLIGRYFPSSTGKGNIVFQPGVFLQALNEQSSLIIDEMNRANLDECFGELFSVLAGQAVDLPYEALDENDALDEKEGATTGEMKNRVLKTVRIAPASDTVEALKDRVTYQMARSFRLIGTMNDADRSALHQLSFALLRRFDMVRITPPDVKDLQSLLKYNKGMNRISVMLEQIDNRNTPAQKTRLRADLGLNKEIFYFFRNDQFDHAAPATLLRSLEECLTALFCPDIKGDQFLGLVPTYVVGVATMLDTQNFALECLRPDSNITPDVGSFIKVSFNMSVAQNPYESFSKSLVTLALTLTVVPQLDALDDDGFQLAVEHMYKCLGVSQFLRLHNTENKCEFELKSDGAKTVSDILFDDIERATRGTNKAEWIKSFRTNISRPGIRN
jgi:MoxR-like ATPase